MPVPAHQHQHSPIPPFIARELRYEQKNFREYFHWKEVWFPEALQVQVLLPQLLLLQVLLLGVLEVRAHDSFGEGWFECAVEMETNLKTLVDQVRIHAISAWPVRQARVRGRFNPMGLPYRKECEVNWIFVNPPMVVSFGYLVGYIVEWNCRCELMATCDWAVIRVTVFVRMKAGSASVRLPLANILPSISISATASHRLKCFRSPFIIE